MRGFMKKEDWTWMGHPGHFIGASCCKFHLNTEVGGYIVSTVGEYQPDREVFEILKCKEKYMEIGYNRLYETMVFKSKKTSEEFKCCPFEAVIGGGELDMKGYNDSGSAYLGHLELCEEWSKIDKGD